MLYVHILYSPLPEEKTGDDSPQPASLDYSQRAARLLGENANKSSSVTVVSVEPLPADVKQIETLDRNNQDEREKIFFLFVISCAADGSVHRSVRRFARSLPKKKVESNVVLSSRCTAALVLLGHARCDNSAKQMEETVYGAGRRLEKALLQSNLFSSSSSFARDDAPLKRCETQVELEGPEDKFDEWVSNMLV